LQGLALDFNRRASHCGYDGYFRNLHKSTGVDFACCDDYFGNVHQSPGVGLSILHLALANRRASPGGYNGLFVNLHHSPGVDCRP
jgi:hypothetical protein